MGCRNSKVVTTDQQLTRFLDDQARIESHHVKNLFIGPSQSGKSTIIRRLIQKMEQGINIKKEHQERKRYIPIIQQNVVDCATDLCQLLKELGYEHKLKEESKSFGDSLGNGKTKSNKVDENDSQIYVPRYRIIGTDKTLCTPSPWEAYNEIKYSLVETMDNIVNGILEMMGLLQNSTINCPHSTDTCSQIIRGGLKRGDAFERFVSLSTAFFPAKRPDLSSREGSVRNDNQHEILMKHLKAIKSLWHSSTVQQAWKKQILIRMTSKTSHLQYLSKLHTIVSSDYIPSEFDVRCSYNQTRTSLSTVGTHPDAIDYIEAKSDTLRKDRGRGGKRNKSLNDLVSFEDFDAIYFVVPLADYDEILSNGRNAMVEAFTDFAALVDQVSASGCRHIGLYLNKIDVFRDKIWRWPLSDVEAFADYSGPRASFDYSLAYIINRFEEIYYDVTGYPLYVIVPSPAINNLSPIPNFYDRPPGFLGRYFD